MSSMVTDEPGLLPGILEAAVRNNKQKAITGMMLYADGNILQVLEGEKATVLETFRVVESDPRHNGIFVLIEQDIATRQFTSWSMGFKQLSKEDLEKLPAAAQFFRAQKEALEGRVQSGDALTILQSFANGSMSIL
jgi:hypothetical protein